MLSATWANTRMGTPSNCTMASAYGPGTPGTETWMSTTVYTSPVRGSANGVVRS